MIFKGDSYETIWLKLLKPYGQELIDVENYFSSMLGGEKLNTIQFQNSI